MAGSYNHVVGKNGGLRSNLGVVDMLENGGDVFEAVEEMYGMIWYLASNGQTQDAMNLSALELVELARENYKEGLSASPTKRYK